MAIPTDERLVEQASSGDLRALETIFKRYHQDLFRYCAVLLGNTEDAADALQNTMVKVLGALPGERRRVHLKAWLYRIAHNESIELLRKRREVDSADPEALVGAHGPEASAETRERLRQLIVDLRELPERQRGALVMRELGGLGFEQIGSAFETSAAVARQTVYEARVGLQEMERGRAMECDEVCRKLSDGDRRVLRRRDLRAHLRQCSACRDFEAAMSTRRADLAAISPIPALAAVGVLKGVAGGATGTAAGAGAAGGAISASVAMKAAATVAVAGAIGVGAADRVGVVRPFHDGNSVEAPAGAGGGGVPAAPAATTTATAEQPRAGDTAARAGIAGRSLPATGHATVPSGSGGKAIAAEPEHLEAPRAAAPQPQGHGVPSASGAPQGHGKAKGRANGAGAGGGAGAANAHGANPNANGGNHGEAAGHGQGEGQPGKSGAQGHAKAPHEPAPPGLEGHAPPGHAAEPSQSPPQAGAGKPAAPPGKPEG